MMLALETTCSDLSKALQTALTSPQMQRRIAIRATDIAKGMQDSLETAAPDAVLVVRNGRQSGIEIGIRGSRPAMIEAVLNGRNQT